MEQDQLSQISQLRDRIVQLEEEMAQGRGVRRDPPFPPASYYTTYHILAGAVLGLIGAASSLLFNIVGSAMVGQHPLELIRVYLTFPLGEKALEISSGFALASGCCLYLGTGMLLGVPIHLVLTRFFSASTFISRLVAASVLGIIVWVVNFYGVLSWLQPALIGGRWIVDRIPVLIGVMTHLVFAWTMLLVNQWGKFVPPSSEKSA
jgi:hypothetical protein